MAPRLITLAIWLAAVAGALAWILPLLGRPVPVPPQAVVATAALPAGGAERLLGSPPPEAVEAAAPAESRFKLIGVVAPRRGSAPGLALISVDGKPARAVAVGREVDAGTTVLAVGPRKVELGPADGTPTLTLELPALPEPSRGRPAEVASATPAPPSLPPPAATPVPSPTGTPAYGAAAALTRAPRGAFRRPRAVQQPVPGVPAGGAEARQ